MNEEWWRMNDERRTNKQTFVTVESILRLKILPCALVPTMRCCSQHCRIGNSIYTVTYFKFCNFCQHKKFVLSLTLNNSVTSLLNVKIKDIFRILIMSRFWYHSWYQIKLDDSKSLLVSTVVSWTLAGTITKCLLLFLTPDFEWLSLIIEAPLAKFVSFYFIWVL